MLQSEILLHSITRTNQQLLQHQIKMSSGLDVNRPSDNAVSSSTISVLDDIIERRDQRLRNLSHAQGVLNTLDSSIGEVSAQLLEAKSIGLSQIGVGSDAQTRALEAQVIDSILKEMFAVGNRTYQQIHLFGGSATANPPLVELLGGVQYVGQGDGQGTDLGQIADVPITMPATDVFGALSARVEGDRDLDPTMSLSTLLSDLRGARGLGITLGSINVDINGTDITVDLSEAHTIGDVIATLQSEIQAAPGGDPGATVDIDPATGNRLRITPSGGVTITIADLVGAGAAADLGIAGTYPGGGPTTGSDINPLLTELTPVSALNGVTVPLGTIRLSNGNQTRDLDLSAAQTIQDIKNAVAGLNIGIRVEINDAGDRLNFINELSGGHMSIAEVAGGTTASELGVRSFTGTTLLSDFNDGLGVEILTGSVNPVTGLPDPSRDLDFRVTLHDGATFDVDLAGAVTVQDVIDTINAAAMTAGIVVPADFLVGLAADGNGLQFTDNTVAGPGAAFTIAALNGSHAAENLGILGSAAGATFTGTDRATVAVDSVFSHLIALRDALLTNDERGTELATQRLEADIERAAQARAVVGVRARRVSVGSIREEELLIQDQSLKSQVQDLDFTEAAIRFTQLQQQLQAGLATASQTTSLSLLDFLR